jgi:hypothetical protein
MEKGFTAFLVLGGFLLSRGAIASLSSRYLRFERLLPETGGAPVTGISSILQDREGYVWFGTIAGLARYDGRRFLFFSPPSGPTAADPSRTTVVFPAIEDSRGDIWIGTDGQGLFRFDKNKEAFVQYRHEPDNPASLSGDTVLAIQEDKSGSLWVGTRLHGLNRFDPETEAFSRVPLDPDAGAVWDLLADRQGFLWAGTQEGGLYRWNPASEEITNFRFVLDDDPWSLGSNTVWTVFQDRQGTVWVGTRGGGLNQFVLDKEEFLRFTGDEVIPGISSRHPSRPSQRTERVGSGSARPGAAWGFGTGRPASTSSSNMTPRTRILSMMITSRPSLRIPPGSCGSGRLGEGSTNAWLTRSSSLISNAIDTIIGASAGMKSAPCRRAIRADSGWELARGSTAWTGLLENSRDTRATRTRFPVQAPTTISSTASTRTARESYGWGRTVGLTGSTR